MHGRPVPRELVVANVVVLLVPFGDGLKLEAVPPRGGGTSTLALFSFARPGILRVYEVPVGSLGAERGMRVARRGAACTVRWGLCAGDERERRSGRQSEERETRERGVVETYKMCASIASHAARALVSSCASNVK